MDWDDEHWVGMDYWGTTKLDFYLISAFNKFLTVRPLYSMGKSKIVAV